MDEEPQLGLMVLADDQNFTTLGGQAKAAIRGHLKTGHREKP
jgi:hypothetical protein